MTNYRPISVLPFTAKLMEKAIANRLTAFVEKLELLSPMQFGFGKHQEFQLLVANIPVSFVALTETWTNKNTEDQLHRDGPHKNSEYDNEGKYKDNKKTFPGYFY